jgi:hypothetical protein
MDIQDLIAKLAAIKEERGNIPVVFAVDAPTQGGSFFVYTEPRFAVWDLQGKTKVVIFT